MTRKKVVWHDASLENINLNEKTITKLLNDVVWNSASDHNEKHHFSFEKFIEKFATENEWKIVH